MSSSVTGASAAGASVSTAVFREPTIHPAKVTVPDQQVEAPENPDLRAAGSQQTLTTMAKVSGTILSNLMQMEHEVLKNYAQNLRA